MLLSRRRRRFGPSVVVMPEAQSRRRSVVFVVLVGALLLGIWTYRIVFTPAGEMIRVATVLSVDTRGRVDVTISGEGESRRAETGLKLYEGDRVATDAVSRAALSFFDGTTVVLDGGSTVLLDSVLQGQQSSIISLMLQSGRIAIASGMGKTVQRSVETAFAISTIPPRSEATLGIDANAIERTKRLAVFATTGPGVFSRIQTGRSTSVTVITGEGQELILTPSAISALQNTDSDPYALRHVLDPAVAELEFVLYARERANRLTAEQADTTVSPAAPSEEPTVDGTALTVYEPVENALIAGTTVLVKGRINSRVTSVKVNGYSADLVDGAFSKEIALPNEESFSLDVQAEGKDGLVIETKSIALRRDIRPPAPPVITSPAHVTAENSAEVGHVSVQEETFEIRGEPPEDAIGIIVNGYQLQKFIPLKPWAYLVDPAIGNVRLGENTYEVKAVDRAGNVSEPVKITILWKAQPVPVIPGNEYVPPRDTSLYLSPGSLLVIAPTADSSSFVTSDEEVLIEGLTAPETASISINGFSLRLYLAGKTTWNYIAKEEFGNYAQGVNRYVIVARNSEGKILDVLRYSIERK